MSQNDLLIGAVMVTFNRLARLQESLPKLLDEVTGPVLVVNNASQDGTGAWLDSLAHPRLSVLHLAENTGGAGGFESGMRALAQSADPDWILLLDDDAWPEPGAITAFRDMAPRLPADTGAVAAAVFLPNGQIAEMNRPGFNPFWYPRKILATLMNGNRAGFKLPDTAFDSAAPTVAIDNASFVGYFVSRSGRQATGWPEGGLFIYGDDVLYSLRLRRAGQQLIFAPMVRFTHDCGSMDAHFVYRPLWKIYYHCRNGVTIARVAAGPLVYPFALAWYMLLWMRRGRRCEPQDRALYNKMMWAGIRDGLANKRGRNDALHNPR